MKLASPDEQVLAPQMSVSRVLEGQVAVDADEFVHRRRVHVEDHVPPWFDVHVFTFCRDLARWPVSRIVPVPRLVLTWYARVDVLVASTDASPTKIVDSLFVIGI